MGFASDPVYIHANRKKDRDFVCIATIDAVPTVSFRLPSANPLLKPGGTEDPTHCQEQAEEKYFLTPGVHKITLAYWDLDAFRYGYGLPAEFEITVQAGQTLRARRQESGWSKTRLWIEDGSGAAQVEAQQVQFQGRRLVRFGRFDPKINPYNVLPSLSSDPVYSGAPITSIAVEIAMDNRNKAYIDQVREAFINRFRECGLVARVRTTLYDDAGAPEATQEAATDATAAPQSFEAKLAISEHGFTYYKQRGLSLFGNSTDPKQNPTNVNLGASLTLGAAEKSVWESGVEVSFPVIGMRNFADGFIGRLSEDGYLKGCPDISRFDH